MSGNLGISQIFENGRFLARSGLRCQGMNDPRLKRGSPRVIPPGPESIRLLDSSSMCVTLQRSHLLSTTHPPMTPSTATISVTVAFLFAAAAETFGQCVSYSVDIYTGPQGCQILPSSAGATGINDAGEMCGGYNICGGVAHSVIWFSTGAVTELRVTVNGEFPSPSDLNLQAEAVGNLSGQSLPLPLAFLYTKGTTFNLGTLRGDTSSEAFAIANNGRIIGYSTGCSPCHYDAVVWENGVATALELPMGPNRIAYDISDSGEFICGWMGVDPNPHFGASAFIWRNGIVFDLGNPLPGSGGTEARGVNNYGQACGSAHFSKKFPKAYSRAFFWSDGMMHDIGVLSGYEHSFGYDLNDIGQVLGRCQDDTGVGEPFIWQNGVMQALEDLIPPELNLSNLNVWDINNAGQIAGYANRPSPLFGDETVAIRLTPIPAMPGDFNCDSQVNVSDLLGVINYWGYTTPNLDFNGDGTVNLPDLIIVLANWSS